MRFLRKTVLIFLLSFLIQSPDIFSQEVISDLYSNPLLKKEFLKKSGHSLLKFSAVNSLTLPFIDDFSGEGVYPDSSKWTDYAVFINRTYPRAPISIGVATFDGLKSNGLPYNFAATGTSVGYADTLTSKPINLNYPVSDSVYFSFYYQAQGLGNAPEVQDSLMLEFFSTVDTSWTKVWSASGYSLSTNDSAFNYVVIPVDTTAFLTDGFRFRFRNKATLSGNVDHWHLDYVYLNRQRTISDSLIQDVAFNYQGYSLLKKYQSVPWKHYQTTDTAGKTKIYIRNNFNSIVQMDYRYVVRDIPGNVLSNYNGGSENIDPFNTSGYSFCQVACPNFATPAVNFTFPILVDTVSYVVEHIINPSADFNRDNDTLRYLQTFHDYYAYDDGTAEAGYGLNMNNGMIAYRFTIPAQDTIRAVDIYFNPIVTNAVQYNFRLAVWNTNGSVPGTIIYSNPNMDAPVYDNGYYKFHRYEFDSLITVPTTFFVGFIQNTNQILNLGFDKNIDNSANMYYNTTGNWINTLNRGSWMMRPVFSPSSQIAIGQVEINSPEKFKVFPNPGNGSISILDSDGNVPSSVDVFDFSGRKLITITKPLTVNLTEFPAGIYVLKITGNNDEITFERYILSH